VVEVGSGGIVDHPGGFESFLWWKGRREEEAAAREREAHDGTARRAGGAPASRGNGASPGGPGGSAARRSRGSARRVRELEARINELEERKAKLEGLLAREDLYRDPEKSAFYLEEYRGVSAELEAAVEEWAAAGEELEPPV